MSLRDLRGKYGPIITVRIGHRPAIFVSSHSIAHRALIQNGAHFSDRPKALATVKIFSSNQHTISSAAYGPTWRLLRRNLTSEILHPSRVKSYTHARQWVLGILIHRLLNSAEDSSVEAVKVVHHFQYAIFCLLVLMCFGDRLDEKQITQIETVQRAMLLSSSRFNMLNYWPKLGKIVFHNSWNELLRMRQDQEEVLIPLIEARVDVLKQRRQGNQEEESSVVAYVDTLVDLELPDEKRKLNNDEMMGWDLKVWDEPMEFKPERFLINNGGNGGREEGEGEATVVFDITGNKEIKMMPFGAGRRICPASGLALLHLEYFVANLVWYFEWTAADGNDGDTKISFSRWFCLTKIS
ncbi:hypothetical protein ACSBR1_039221 [Camellia fascicularis]